MFHDLLLLSPFNKAEEKAFNEIVSKRNLLVHHAGYYTLQHLKHNTISQELKQRAFKEAIKIDTKEYGEVSDFLFEMAMKFTRESVTAVKKLSEFTSLVEGDVKVKAVEELLQGIWDTLGE